MIAKPHSIVTERLSLFGHAPQICWGRHRPTIREHASEFHCCSSLASVCDLQSFDDLASLSCPSLPPGEGRGEGNSTARQSPCDPHAHPLPEAEGTSFGRCPWRPNPRQEREQIYQRR